MVHHQRGGPMTPRRCREERGVTLITVCITLVALLGTAALVIDLGNARQVRRQAQSAADACALAGAEEIADIGAAFTGSTTQWAAVVSACKDYAAYDFGVAAADWQGCTDSAHLAFTPDSEHANSCISADRVAWPNPQTGETTWQNRIRVQIPDRAVGTAFGGVFSRSTLSTRAVAVAGITRKRTSVRTTRSFSVAGGPCAICLLGDGLALDGQNGDIQVSGGSVVVDAQPASGYAASLLPNGHVRVLGGGTIGGPGGAAEFSGAGWSPAPVLRDAVVDPLATVPPCATGSTCPTNAASASGTVLDPGVYTTISGSHALNPGVYVVKGGITLRGNDLLTGSGVMLYLACSTYPAPCAAGTAGARITATGNGALRVTAPTARQCESQPSVCPYVGLTIFADRQNTAVQTFRGNGTNEAGAASGSSGTLYLRSGTLDLRGNGYTLTSMIVAGRITMVGNPSGITIAYDLSRNYDLSHEEFETVVTEAYSYDATGLER